MRWPLAVPEEQTGGRKSKGSEARKDCGFEKQKESLCRLRRKYGGGRFRCRQKPDDEGQCFQKAMKSDMA